MNKEFKQGIKPFVEKKQKELIDLLQSWELNIELLADQYLRDVEGDLRKLHEENKFDLVPPSHEVNMLFMESINRLEKELTRFKSGLNFHYNYKQFVSLKENETPSPFDEVKVSPIKEYVQTPQSNKVTKPIVQNEKKKLSLPSAPKANEVLNNDDVVIEVIEDSSDKSYSIKNTEEIIVNTDISPIVPPSKPKEEVEEEKEEEEVEEKKLPEIGDHGIDYLKEKTKKDADVKEKDKDKDKDIIDSVSSLFGKKKTEQINPPVIKEYTLTEHQKIKFGELKNYCTQILDKPIEINRNPAHYMIQFIGAAGVGKTTVSNEIIKFLLENYSRYSIGVCAPTHQALNVITTKMKEVGLPVNTRDEFTEIIAKTTVSYLSIKKTTNYDNNTSGFKRSPRPSPTTDILIVDEAGMVPLTHLNFICQERRIKLVIYMGDIYQLTAVEDTGPSPVFNLPLCVELTQPMRQDPNSGILALCNEVRGLLDLVIRQGHTHIPYDPKSVVQKYFRQYTDIWITNNSDEFNSWYINDGLNYEDKIISSYTNKVAKKYKEMVRYGIVHNPHFSVPENMYFSNDSDVFNKTKSDDAENGTNNLDVYKQKIDPTKSNSATEIPYCIGEILVTEDVNQQGDCIIHQNNTSFEVKEIRKQIKEYFYYVDTNNNGKIYINDIPINYEQCQKYKMVVNYYEITDTENKIIRVVANESLEDYNRILTQIYKECEKSKKRGKWRPFGIEKEFFTPVSYPYGCTLHKLQGSTIKTCYLDMRDFTYFWQQGNMEIYRLLYVAISRPSENLRILI